MAEKSRQEEDLPPAAAQGSGEVKEQISAEEQRWLENKSSLDMLRCLLGRSNDGRKLELLAVACFRSVQDSVHDSNQKKEIAIILKGVENVIEKKIDRQVIMNLGYANDSIIGQLTDYIVFNEAGGSPNYIALANILEGSASDVAEAMGADYLSPEHTRTRNLETESQADIMRDIFGNPFAKEKSVIESSWRNETVMGLANTIYENKLFDRMPILADALEDAGCQNLEILKHCRSTDCSHVRGCWVLDLILQKE